MQQRQDSEQVQGELVEEVYQEVGKLFLPALLLPGLVVGVESQALLVIQGLPTMRRSRDT